ncbi:copper chaperone PCu(A)C [Pseudolysobacter antarcticus]|nr:copper chaperone PCu(A)C [Pseudolysobacter antarcticus]
MRSNLPRVSGRSENNQGNRCAWVFASLLAAMTMQASAAGHLLIEHAWIREAPPSAMMLAGYAVLRNDGDAAVEISTAQSKVFGDVSIHETVLENGVSRMHELHGLQIAPGAEVALAPGGKHLMLMDAKIPVVAGTVIELTLILTDGRKVSAAFIVSADTPSPAAH